MLLESVEALRTGSEGLLLGQCHRAEFHVGLLIAIRARNPLHDLLVTGGDVPKPSGLPALPPRGVSWQVVRHEAFIPGSQLMHELRLL